VRISRWSVSCTTAMRPMSPSNSASTNSGKDCASSAIWKDRTSSLRCATQRGTSIVSPSWRRNSSASRWTSLVVHGPQGVRAAKDATSTIPIVMARMDDADEHGFVASLARPGGNITGLSYQTGELSGKLLELLKDALPSLARGAVLWDATGTANQRRALEQAAPALGVHLHVFEVRSPDEFEGAFAAAHTAQAEGLVILGSPVVTQHAPRLAALAVQHRLPAIYSNRRFAEAGGLMAYGPKESDSSWGERRAAVFVDKILKGSKPADGAAQAVRAGAQPQGRCGPWPDHAPVAPLSGRRSDPIGFCTGAVSCRGSRIRENNKGVAVEEAPTRSPRDAPSLTRRCSRRGTLPPRRCVAQPLQRVVSLRRSFSCVGVAKAAR